MSNTGFSTAKATPDTHRVAFEIFRQISIDTKMSCGCRDWVADESSLKFTVGGGRHTKKIIVTLNWMDTYDIRFVVIEFNSKKATQIIGDQEICGVYADQLNDTIYTLVNK